MKKEIADKWIAALRSGTYQQGKKRLNRSGKYCCLGVLCEVALESGLNMSVSTVCDCTFYNGSNSILSDGVMQWADVGTEWGGYDTSDPRICLARDNDNGKTFDEIADIIEQYWEDL